MLTFRNIEEIRTRTICQGLICGHATGQGKEECLDLWALVDHRMPGIEHLVVVRLRTMSLLAVQES